MNTKEKNEFDEEMFLNPKPGKLKRRGTLQDREARRRASAKERITIRLDSHIVEKFKELSGGEGYQSLINQALQEWLSAQGVKELVRDELSTLASRVEEMFVHNAKKQKAG